MWPTFSKVWQIWHNEAAVEMDVFSMGLDLLIARTFENDNENASPCHG